MANRVMIWVILVLLFVSGVAPASTARAATPVADDAAPVVKLKAGTIGSGQEPVVAAGLTIDGYDPGERGMYIVQFAGSVEPVWRDGLTALGADVLDYLPDYAFKVRMTPEQAAQVTDWAFVNLVTLFQPAFKLDPALDLGGPRLYRVRIEADADFAQAVADVAGAVSAVVQQHAPFVRVLADDAQLAAVARLADVAWIENFTVAEKHNEYGGGAILGAIAVNAAGYDGATQILAVADTGLGRGSTPGAHLDIPPDRIINILNYPGDSSPGCYTIIDNGARDLNSGHGTHVAVSALGDGGPNGEARGVAPSARLVFQAVEDYVDFTDNCALVYADGYYLYGIPDALEDLFQGAYDAGARVHSNSWGAPVAGIYSSNSAAADDFIWRRPDMTIVYSAGNAGTDADADGFVDPDSLDAPATAKNVITVGASENDRAGNYACDTTLTYPSNDPFQGGQSCADMGGQNELGSYGDRWPQAFPVAPLSVDVTAGNPGQMAPFSSRGPTDDGRIKPDVVAPGTWVLSGYSQLSRQGYDDEPNSVDGRYQSDGWGMPLSDRYKYFGGTSMATPLVSGAATIVRDRYQRDFDHQASAALVKATLINTAVDLPDENNDGLDDNDFPIPNIHEGWGRVDLMAATQIAEFVDESVGVLTAGAHRHTYFLAPGSPFRVTLVWSDFPASEAAAVSLVNDLDLEVTSPAGETYLGNVFSGGWSQAGGAPDRVNNVENVFLPDAAGGEWSVVVRGHNVPSGSQPYALVVDGAVETPSVEPVDEPPTVTITGPLNGASVEALVNITADATDDNGVARVEFYVDGGLLGVDTAVPFVMNWDSSSAVNGLHKVGVKAFDTAAQTAEAQITVMLDNPPPDLPPMVSIIAPEENAVVEELVTIAVNAEDDVGIASVEVWVDGQQFAIDETPPYIVHWDSRDVPNGLHYILVTVTDSAGQWRDANVIVQVDNPPVNILEPLSIVQPADNAVISGTVTVEAQIATPTADLSLEFYVDGRSIGARSAPPYAVEWDSRGVANGKRILSTLMITGSGIENSSVEVTVDNPPPVASLLLSTAQGGDVGFSFSDEDILRYDPNTATWSMFFDGSDVGLGASYRHDVDAFHLMSDGTLLLSLDGNASIPDAGWADDSDIVRFIPQTLGQNTSGRFELYFEGSDVGLAHDGEDIDAVALLANGDIVVSTSGLLVAPGIAGRDEDLFRFTPRRLGGDTAGTWTRYVDGSDIGLGADGQEDIVALAGLTDGTLYVSTPGTWSGAGGTGTELYACALPTGDAQAQCNLSLFWSGASAGLAGQKIDALGILPSSGVALAPMDNTPRSDPIQDSFDSVNGDVDVEDDYLLYLPFSVR